MIALKSAAFSIDSIPDVQFPGYTDGSDWNGFDCPFFEFEVAQDVLRRSEINGFEWRYSAEREVFVVRYLLDPDEESVEYEGSIVEVDGREVRVFPIGTRSWIWEAVQ